jgi:hypothetical protein
MFYIHLVFLHTWAAHEITWKNIVESGRPQITVWRMRIACWIHKANNTHSEYVIHIAFLLQQLLGDRLSILHYTYTSFLYTSLIPKE